jgi:hypothetical protein
MKQTPHPDILDNLARCLAWTSYEDVMSLDDVRLFINSIALEEPDPIVACLLYQKYCESVNEAAMALAKNLR